MTGWRGPHQRPNAPSEAETAALRRVELARQHVLHMRGEYTRRRAGRADVTTAEHQHSRALDDLDVVRRGRRIQGQP